MSDHASKADDRAEHRAADRRRAAKLRQRREQAGQVRIQAWVPRERAAYARQVLHAAAAGTNTLPPDPGHQAELDAAKAEAGALRAKLEETRAVGDRAGRDAQERATEAAAAVARAEATERGRDEAARELAAVRAEAEAAQRREQAAQKRADALQGELAGIRARAAGGACCYAWRAPDGHTGQGRAHDAGPGTRALRPRGPLGGPARGGRALAPHADPGPAPGA